MLFADQQSLMIDPVGDAGVALLALLLSGVAVWAGRRAKRTFQTGESFNHWERRKLRGAEARRAAWAWAGLAAWCALGAVVLVSVLVTNWFFAGPG